MRAIPSSAILSRKGIARYGGVPGTGPLSICLKYPPLKLLRDVGGSILRHHHKNQGRWKKTRLRNPQHVPAQLQPLLSHPLLSKIRKILAPVKIKSALPLSPPPPQKTKIPPLKRGILWAWWFPCRKKAIFPGSRKIGAAISGPIIAGKTFYGHEDFSEKRLPQQTYGKHDLVASLDRLSNGVGEQALQAAKYLLTIAPCSGGVSFQIQRVYLPKISKPTRSKRLRILGSWLPQIREEGVSRRLLSRTFATSAPLTMLVTPSPNPPPDMGSSRGFAKRGRRNGVTSDFPFFAVFFHSVFPFFPFFFSVFSVFFRFFPFHFNSVHTRCIVKTSGFTRGVCKNRDFLKLKGFLVEFLENRRS